MTDLPEATPNHRENIAWNLRLAEAVDNDRSWLEQQLEPTRDAAHQPREANVGGVDGRGEHDDR